MEVKIKDIYLGKPDAKDEISSPSNKLLESFILPPNFDVNDFFKDDYCFIKGYKGSGKTALLIYLRNYIRQQYNESYTSFLYFKDYDNYSRNNMDNLSKKYNEIDENGWYHCPNTGKDFWFNTPDVIKAKTDYAINNGCGGVMIWHYNCDLPSTHEDSLLKAIGTAIK